MLDLIYTWSYNFLSFQHGLNTDSGKHSREAAFDGISQYV